MANLEEADLKGANLKNAKELTCDQLIKAKNWEQAYRNPILFCGSDIPI